MVETASDLAAGVRRTRGAPRGVWGLTPGSSWHGTGTAGGGAEERALRRRGGRKPPRKFGDELSRSFCRPDTSLGSSNQTQHRKVFRTEDCSRLVVCVQPNSRLKEMNRADHLPPEETQQVLREVLGKTAALPSATGSVGVPVPDTFRGQDEGRRGTRPWPPGGLG